MSDTTQGAESLPKKILKVRDLLADKTLAIPQYQRPYKWTRLHVTQLFSDIAQHHRKSAYRLGTVVFHHDLEKNENNIVDGQQRTITLLLIVHALIKHRLPALENKHLKAQLERLRSDMFQPSFSSDISQRNIWTNYREIERTVSRPEFAEAQIDFVLNRCELVSVTLSDISEAFQFFDAQNARGRDLDPHDLLKAFHLREFSETENALKATTVHAWENSGTEDLATLFAEYLYRIRRWVKGESARHFGKKDVDLFKGVNVERVGRYPFVTPLRMTHHLVDKYNASFTRHIDGQRMTYPFQLDQTIVNGRRFFEMISHYQERGFHRAQSEKVDGVSAKQAAYLQGCTLNDLASQIFSTLDSYEGRHRTGDGYVRGMFNCLLMCYMDKFGTVELSAAIEKIFIWAYRLRIEMENVQLASMDNHVLENNLFRELRDATDPQQFCQHSLPIVNKISKVKHIGRIKALFIKMKYLEQPNESE